MPVIDISEKCENCGRAIGKLETARLLNEHVVCANCDALLRAQQQPVTTPTPTPANSYDPLSQLAQHRQQPVQPRIPQKPQNDENGFSAQRVILMLLIVGVIVVILVLLNEWSQRASLIQRVGG